MFSRENTEKGDEVFFFKEEPFNGPINKRTIYLKKLRYSCMVLQESVSYISQKNPDEL